MFFDDQKLIRMLKDAPTASTVKIFYFIAHNQPSDGITGYETTKEQLAFDLNLKTSTIFAALHWLKANGLINELKQIETIDFMANPYYVMKNSDRQARIAEFTRRDRIFLKKESEAKQRKRIRELKKTSNQ